VKGEAKPWINCVFLFIGGVLANFIGTTGASMLLIRPWIRMNKFRITGFHVVFFIFIVSNVGGCLTPVGDPPLFLGYIKGVPFWWTLLHCWRPWLLMMGVLMLVFYILDRANFLRAPLLVRKEKTVHETWGFEGLQNVAALAVILGAVLIERPAGLREVMMLAAAAVSYWRTPKAIHEANDFNWHPAMEVAWLFAGIFATMVPALDYIGVHAQGLGLNAPGSLYWLTGGLSGILDNAPTYLTFLAGAMGANELDINNTMQVMQFAAKYEAKLLAISVASVFFGAMTYIGNGPNFMVKSVCEHAKVNTPSFLNYVMIYSLPILLPVLVVEWLVFISKWRLF
jgi:Na+/H+ antiporter NhaD/arsenite permease-like protein